MDRQVSGVIVAIDIGGTRTRVALAHWPDPGASGVRLDPIAGFPTDPDYEAEVARLARAVAAAQRRAGEARIAGAGVSVGGRVARDGGSVAVAPNLPAYEGRPLAAGIEERSGLTVRLAHDTVCGLLGETRYGALRGESRCAYLTLSTGLGAAVHLAGASGGVMVSIEMGHQLLDGCERKCLCGQVGCLETYVGGRQLQSLHGAPLEALEDATVWDDLALKLSGGLVNLAQLTRVEVAAVGGAVALARPALLGDLQRRVDDRLRGMSLRIVPAALGERAPLVGAAALLDTDPGSILN